MHRFITNFAVSLGVLALAAGSTTQAATAAVRGSGQTMPIQLPKGLTFVPVGASINGKPVRVVLDTGTGGIVVDERFAKAAGLKIGKSLGQAAGAGKGDQSIYSLQLRSVRFGPIHLRHVSAIAANLGPLFADTGKSFAAVLGYQVFEHHVVVINYAKRTLAIYQPDKAPACRSPIPIMEFVGHTPVVAAKVRFQGSNKVYKTHLIVDTGTGGGVAVALGGKFLGVKAVQSIIARKPKVGGNGTGGKVASWKGTLAELDVGGQHFHDVLMGLSKQVKVFNSGQVSGSLGVGMWDKGSLTVDYPHRQLCINVQGKNEAPPDTSNVRQAPTSRPAGRG